MPKIDGEKSGVAVNPYLKILVVGRLQKKVAGRKKICVVLANTHKTFARNQVVFDEIVRTETMKVAITKIPCLVGEKRQC